MRQTVLLPCPSPHLPVPCPSLSPSRPSPLSPSPFPSLPSPFASPPLPLPLPSPLPLPQKNGIKLKPKLMGPLSIRHGTAQHVIARTQNETRWVARFWWEHYCRTWREDLCHFTHQFVSCSFLFRAMENPPTSAALAELDSDPDSPHLDQFPPGPQRSSLGLYHSLHNHLRHPDVVTIDGRPGRKRGVSI